MRSLTKRPITSWLMALACGLFASQAVATFEQGDEYEEFERLCSSQVSQTSEPSCPHHPASAPDSESPRLRTATPGQFGWELAKRNQGLFSGLLSGLANSLLCYPLDNRMTVDQVRGKSEAAPASAQPKVAQASVMREHYRKYSWNTLTNTVGLAWVFWSRPRFERMLERNIDKGYRENPAMAAYVSQWITKEVLVESGASIAVGASQAFVVGPISTMKVRAQTNNNQAILSVYWEMKQLNNISLKQRRETASQVIKALWAGSAVQAGRNITFWLVQDPVQKSLRQSNFVQVELKDVNAVIKNIGVGGVSGVIAAVPAYPWDTISKKKKNEGTTTAFHKMVPKVLKEEGLAGLYRAFPKCGARMFIACAVMNTVCEGVNGYFADDTLADQEEEPSDDTADQEAKD